MLRHPWYSRKSRTYYPILANILDVYMPWGVASVIPHIRTLSKAGTNVPTVNEILKRVIEMVEQIQESGPLQEKEPSVVFAIQQLLYTALQQLQAAEATN